MGRKNFPHERRNKMTLANTCTSKVGLTRKIADRRARDAMARDGVLLRSYHCSYCGRWHVTSRELVK